MKNKHEKLLRLVFQRPVSANVKWREVERFLLALGATIKERGGSRVAILLEGRVLYQHRPHPSPDMDKGAVSALRDFLESLNIRPEDMKDEHHGI